MAGIIEPGYKVLIIDDESAIRDLIIQILEPDFECHTAGSAEEALTILKNESFDLVMSDINMGGMSGIELIPLLDSSTSSSNLDLRSGRRRLLRGRLLLRGNGCH